VKSPREKENLKGETQRETKSVGGRRKPEEFYFDSYPALKKEGQKTK